MSKHDKTQAELEHEFDSAAVPTANMKAMRPFSELLEEKHPPQNSAITKSSFPTAHSGHRHAAGMSSNRVPGAMPSSGRPSCSL
jgi:hypothetical protein